MFYQTILLGSSLLVYALLVIYYSAEVYFLVLYFDISTYVVLRSLVHTFKSITDSFTVNKVGYSGLIWT